MNNTIRDQISNLTNGLLGRIVCLVKETAIKIIVNELPEVVTIDLLQETARELELADWKSLLMEEGK